LLKYYLILLMIYYMSNFTKLIRKYGISIVALIFNVLMWLWLIVYIKPTGESHVLHYNIYFGIDQIGPGIKLFLFPLFGLIILVINILFTLTKNINYKLIVYSSLISLLSQILLIVSILLLIINHY